MNNFCTNCGEELDKNDLFCHKCNVPVIDLTVIDYKFIRKKRLYYFFLFAFIILFIITFSLIVSRFHSSNIKTIQRNYVEPYLKEKYNNSDFSVEYKFSGVCINNYYDKMECISYYFTAEYESTKLLINVEYDFLGYSVVEKSLKDIESSSDISENSDEKSIFKESTYYSVNSNNNIFVLDNYRLTTYSSASKDNEKISFIISFANLNSLVGEASIVAKVYDNSFNELGFCKGNINLSENNKNEKNSICQLSNDNLYKDKSIDDVSFYKIVILSFDFNK